MRKIQFKCTLLSDVVISESSATEGRHHALDFIPGNNFLGVAASSLYKDMDDRTWTIFHSGKVRFGDAHPSQNGIRGLRVPASMYYPKLGSVYDECYVHHCITNFDALRSKQLKQCRNGFYAFNGNTATAIKVDKDFSIKSAYDSAKRRSEDEKMFGYESIAKGTEFMFDVEFDDDVEAYVNEVADALCGDRHIGRSRSAQYGWVRIEKANETTFLKEEDSITNDVVTVYAEGRLVFFDENGMPTFRPNPKDLGIDSDDAKIIWSKSQIRTFQYAPWNFTRQAYDDDRCGIEKGSVFVVETSAAKKGEQYVGAYQNEGFGKIIYNPYFLNAQPGKNGLSVIKFENVPETKQGQKASGPVVNSRLIGYLRLKSNHQGSEHKVYELVNTFVNDNTLLFDGERFASQWGTIRSLAMESSEGIQQRIEDYLDHGVAAEQWKERGRLKVLMDFMNKPEVQRNLQDVIINLASEMAKKLRQGK